MLKVDRAAGVVSVTPILSWREAEFVAAYADKAGERFAQRSPIERAIIAFVTPHLLPLEKELVQKNEFKVTFHRVRLAPERPDRRDGLELMSGQRLAAGPDRTWISDSPTKSPSSPARAAGSGWRARGRSWPRGAACASARAATSGWPRRRSKSKRRRERPNMVVAVQADVSTADGVELVDRPDGRDVRRARHPRQQRRPRRRRGSARHVRRRVAGGVRRDALSGDSRVAPRRAAHEAARRRRDRHDRVDLRPRGRRPHDLQRRQGRGDQPRQVAGAAARAASTSASTASRPDRSCFPAAPGTGASRPIPTASPTSSGASCRSAASAAPTKSAPSSPSSPRRAPAGSAARASSSTAVRGDRISDSFAAPAPAPSSASSK